MPNNINSSTSNSSCLQYQSQQSTSANLQCQQQDNLTRINSEKNEQVIRDTKPYISSSGDTSSSALNITSRPIKEKTLPCGYPSCDKTFPNKSKLDRHQRIHTGEKPYKCTLCNTFFTQMGSLNRHRLIHNQSQQSTSANLQCQQQDNLTRINSEKNEQVIRDTKPYISSSGDTSSSALNITSRPIKEKTLPCGYPSCDKTFPNKSKLDRHQRIHTGEKPYKCTLCNTFFTQMGSLNRHRLIHNQSQQSTSANLQCQQQDNLTRLDSEKNEQVIRDTKPYISSSGDTSSSALNITNRLIKEKTLPCGYPSCDKTFPSKSKLDRHQRIHTGEKPYKCTLCNTFFTQMGSLNRHRLIHTGENPYKCTICNTYFTGLSGLRRYRLIHTGAQSHKCTICDKVFNRIDNLNQHFKKKHTKNNQIREIIKNCNASKKNILKKSYNSIVKQCQDKSISIEETLVNIFSILDKKDMLNDDVQNIADKLVSIITQLPPQFKSTSCLDIRDDEKIKTYTDIAFILKNHTADEFLEKYLKIDILQSGDNQDLSTKKRTRSDSLNDDESTPSKKIKSADEIKIEPSSELTLDIDGLQITSTSKFVQTHNNALPILHAPRDDTKDLMPESENTKLKIFIWGDNLKAIFATMPQDEQKQAKQSIRRQCNDWVILNRDKREEYAKNLDDSLEITIPMIDEVERGASVFAKKPFKIFDVIGPYSGALYTNQKDLNNRMRKQGTSNVMEFLFNTMSKNRYIDGTQGGNTLSYINTGQLLDYPRIAENNLAIIHAGNNFSFYVAIKPIAQGEELFIDYGPKYIGREQIKVEAE